MSGMTASWAVQFEAHVDLFGDAVSSCGSVWSMAFMLTVPEMPAGWMSTFGHPGANAKRVLNLDVVDNERCQFGLFNGFRAWA